MKRNLLYIISALSILASCGKYGYEFEHGYQQGDESGTGKDTSMSYIDDSMFDQARIYPGMVGSTVRRIDDTTVNIPLNFRWVKSQDLKVNVAPSPVFSTGLYAPAGENIRITVPAGIIGLTAQIGVHMDNLTGKDPLRRQPILYTVKELFPGDNYIRNPFGGLIWIRASLTAASEVPIRFSGAVRSPDFIHGVSNQEEWLAEVEATEVPWLELRAKHTIFSVPRSLVLRHRNLLSVDASLSEWNESYAKDYYDWMGLTDGHPDVTHAYPELPERGVLDIQPSVGYAHSGFPWVAQQDQYWFLSFARSIIESGGAWGTYHEIGHNYQQTRAWSWSALGETSNNLFIFKAANRLGTNIATHPQLQTAFTSGVAYASSTGAKNFNTLSHLNDGEKPFFRLTPFLQIFNKAVGKNGETGWDFMPYVYTQSRNANISFALDQAKIDFFYRTLCDFTGMDYQRFFSSWGIPLSNVARREMRNAYPAMDQAIWTYNPWDGSGGDGAIGSKYDLSNSLFTYTPNAETATNDGAGIPALNDGNFNNYWHTCWSGCSAPAMPLTIDIDMKGVEAYKGFFYGNRPGHGMYAQKVRVYKSNDGTNWMLIGEYLSQPNLLGQRIEVTFDEVHESRYFRWETPEGNIGSNGHVAVAELGLFYDN